MAECENLRVGREYLSSVSWSSALRKEDHDRCYCSQCYPSTYDDTLTVAGHTYVIPRGWTRFGVRIDEGFAEHHRVWDTWANCYHGTSIENAKSIVEHRQLLLPRDVTMEGKQLQIREGHIPEEYFFFTSPTIRYAGLECYAYTYEFRSPHNSQLYMITVALQCKQKPKSFIIQPETVGAEKQQKRICPHIPNDQLEWKTRQRSAIMPYALLFQVRRSHDNEDSDLQAKPIPPMPVTTDQATVNITDEYSENERNMTKKRIGLLIMLFISTFLPIVALAFGLLYRTDCSIQPRIPQWMIIFGAAGAGTFALLFCITFMTFKCCSHHRRAGVRISISILCLLFLFFLAWLIMGSLWLFPTRSKVQFNQPDIETYCQEKLYMFTFGLLLAQYGLLGLLPCFCCIVVVLYRKYRY